MVRVRNTHNDKIDLGKIDEGASTADRRRR